MNVRPWTGKAEASAVSDPLTKELERRVQADMDKAREELLPPGLLQALDTSDIEERVTKKTSKETGAPEPDKAEAQENADDDEEVPFADDNPLLRAAFEGMVESTIQQGGMFAIACRNKIVGAFAGLEMALWEYHLTAMVLENGGTHEATASPAECLEWYSRRKQAEVALHMTRADLEATIEGATRAITKFRSISQGDGPIIMGGFGM